MRELAVGTKDFAVLGVGLGVDLHALEVGLAKEGELPALALAAAELKRVEGNPELHRVVVSVAGGLGFEFDVVRHVHLVVHVVGRVVLAHVELHAVGIRSQEHHVARIAVDVEGDSDKVVVPRGVAAVEVGPEVAGVDAAAKGHVQGLVVFKNVAFGGQRCGAVVARIDFPAQRQTQRSRPFTVGHAAVEFEPVGLGRNLVLGHRDGLTKTGGAPREK